MALIDKASLLMVPSTYEAGKLYNVLPSGNRAPDNKGGAGYDQTRADFDFDRGSNAAATRINSSGLIEKYRENLLLQSNNFGTTWVNSNTTETGGQADKDGGTNAWLLTKTATNGGIRQNNTTTGVQTFSFYAKAADSNWVKVNNLGSSAYHQANFDLVNGVVGTTDYIIDAKIEDVGNGWFRCITTYNTTLVNIDVRVADSDNVVSGSSGSIYIQSAQVESSLVATDYLNSTSVTAKAGVLIDLPRINYDANGENGALLLEPSRQQLVQYSEYFGASNWNKTRATINDNVSTSPEGVQNAAKIISTAVNDSHYIRHDVSSTTGVCYVFAKADDFTFLKLATNAHSFSPSFFNLTNGEVTKSALYDAEIEPYGNGWYKCIIKPTDAFTQFFVENAGDSASATHLGDGVKGVLIYGAQAESNATYATSYIPNHGTSGGVTRAADSCSGAGDASTFNDSEGVFYAEFSTLSLSDLTERQVTISNASNNSYIRMQYGGTPGTIYLFIYINGVKVADIRKAGLDTTNQHKVAIRYGSGGYSGFVDGVLIETDAYAGNFVSYPLNSLDFFNWKGNVKQVAVFNEALSDSELATLTTL